MSELDHEAQKLLNHLVTKIWMVKPGTPTTYVTYGQVLHELRLPEPNTRMGQTHGDVLQEHGLDALALWSKETGKPMITGIVVNQAAPRRPSSGYFKLNDSGLPDDDWWEDEVRKTVEFDWTPFVSHSVAAELRARESQAKEPPEPEPPATPIARDNVEPEPADRQKVEVYRTLRDSAKARRVKARHNYRCQVCFVEPITLRDGALYAEAHHIKPLGGQYLGPDKESNILFVCPHCHVLLDYGVIPLEFDKLEKVERHELDEAMIEYHNSKIYGRK